MLITNICIAAIGIEEISQGYIKEKDGKIIKVGAMPAPTPEIGEDVFDFNGAMALPGLIDAHSHLGLFGDSTGEEGEDGNEMTDPLTPQLRALDAVNPLDRGFEEALDYGVTTVLTMPGSANAICGQGILIKTKGNCIDDMVIRAPACMKMALGENPKGVYGSRHQTPSSRMGITALIRDELYRTLRHMEDIESAEQDDELDMPEFDAKLEALIPVLKGELAVHIHAHRADDIFTAVRIIKEFSLKGVIVHATQSHIVAQKLAKENIPMIIGPMIATRSKPELASACRETAGILSCAGVVTAICTDHPEMPQEYLMLSAGIAHQNGMDAQKALESITSTAGKICGAYDRIGSLEVGKDCDVVIFNDNPLKTLAKPIAVFLEGKRVR